MQCLLNARSRRRLDLGRAVVACLSTFAPGLCGETWVLREAALFIRDALSALTAGLGRELAILREAALRARDALSAFTACFGSERAILREAALLIRNSSPAHAGDLALPLLFH